MLAPSVSSSVSLPIARTPSPNSASRSRTRFTLDGDEALERRLAEICERALEGVEQVVGPRRLEALLLGGGYGRGEGGVLKSDGTDLPYNDLEFYVFVAGNRLRNRRRHRAALHQLAKALTRSIGVDVEFNVTSLAHWRRSPVSMFSYDLMLGHQSLGKNRVPVSGFEHHYRAEEIPLAEATRLLMNRFSGLLFAREKLAAEPFAIEAADFVRRNLAKAQLGLGDAVLTAFGQYHWSCLERHERLRCLTYAELLPWRTAIIGHHAAGVDFKLYPRRTDGSAAGLQLRHDAITALGLRIWLWLESRRLGVTFRTARDYSLSRADKCPETARWRNVLVNGYALFPSRFKVTRGLRHPRERVLNALAWLLWGQPSSDDAEAFHHLQRELGTRADTMTALIPAYRSLWQHCC